MKKIITYGPFDLFRKGHYRLLKRAKRLGDYLIVEVITEHYDEPRGKLNVMDSLMDRVGHVKQTGLANQTIIKNHVGQKVEDVQKYGVDVFTVGSGWIRAFDYLKQYYQVVYLERTKDASGTMLEAKNFSLIRLGIIGCDRITKRMVPEVRCAGGIYVESVYNPKMKSARKFAEANELKLYTNNMDKFFNQIDTVYIASPHGAHYGYAEQSLMAGKHVLCEKPVTLNRKGAEELPGLAEEENCILTEGIKTVYCPGFMQMLSITRSGVIGAIRDVETYFTKLMSPILRELIGTQTGRSFTELTSYTLLAIIEFLRDNYQGARSDGFWAPNGVDTCMKAYIRYLYSLTESKTGLGVKSEGQLIIPGTKGCIKVTAPWWKTQELEMCYEDTSQSERYLAKLLGDDLRYEINDFISAINGFEKSDYRLTTKESIVVAGVMEEFLTMRNNKGETEDERS